MMSTDNELARPLDQCLDQIQQGELGLEECLRQHPEQAEELAPLLTAAVTARRLAPSGPSAQFRASTKARLLNLARARRRKSSKRAAARTGRRPNLPRWRPTYAVGAVLLALLLLGGSFGAAYASGDALPGDALYGLKRGVEQITLTLTLSDAAEARLLQDYAERRVDEVQGLLQAGRVDDLDTAAAGYQATVELALTLTGSESGELANLESTLSQQESALMAALESAPDPAVPALQAALSHAQHGLQTVELIRSGGDPSQLAPGQLKKAGDDEQPGEQPAGQQNKSEGRVPPGQLKKQAPGGEGLEELPPGQQKQNVCDPEHPGRGNRPDRLCPDQ